MKAYPGEDALAKAFAAGVEFRKNNPRVMPDLPHPAGAVLGKQIPTGSTMFAVAPLTLGEARRLMEKGVMAPISTHTPQGQIDRVTPAIINQIVEAVFLGAQKNYPGLSREEVEEMLDLSNYKDAWLAATGVPATNEKGEKVSVTFTETRTPTK